MCNKPPFLFNECNPTCKMFWFYYDFVRPYNKNKYFKSGTAILCFSYDFGLNGVQ